MSESFRYRAEIEYLGTNLGGWQRQKDVLTVQQVLEDAVFSFSDQNVTFFAAGRTDAGVHALGQVVHFDLMKYYDPYKLMHTINHFVTKHAVGVVSCSIVGHDFHARFSAKSRHYVYKIINRKAVIIIDRGYKYWIKEYLDVSMMQEGANFLIGRHDFSSFRSSICQAKSPIKTLSQIVITRNHDEILIYVVAPSFLHHMVRNIVGSLVLVGTKRWNPQKIAEILEHKDRRKAGPTAPAEGLYFIQVDY